VSTAVEVKGLGCLFGGVAAFMNIRALNKEYVEGIQTIDI